MKPAKKSFIVSLILLISGVFAHGQIFQTESKFNVSIEPFFGFNNGYFGEYIYSKNSQGNYCPISYLEWQEELALKAGLNILVSYKKLSLLSNFELIFPQNSGNMTDSDWMTLTDLKTTYSIHPNEIKDGFKTNQEFSYSFKLHELFTVKPVAAIEYDTVSFNGGIGEGWKGQASKSSDGKNHAWNSEYAYKCRVAGIDYTRHSFEFQTGAALEYQLFSKFRLVFKTLVSPYAYVYARDRHHDKYNSLENAQTFLYVQNSFFKNYSFNLRGIFDYRKNCYFWAEFSYFKKNALYEKFYSNTYTEIPTLLHDQKGGASAQLLDFKFGIKIDLL